jgi:primosomal protein N' (replication factor Y) (superfamily II helicase)
LRYERNLESPLGSCLRRRDCHTGPVPSWEMSTAPEKPKVTRVKKARAVEAPPAGRIVRVLPDEPGINKTFDYRLPDHLVGSGHIRLGSIVRFSLHGRQLRGWITGIDVEPSTDLERIKNISKVTGFGPPRELLSLSRWAAHRWWGRPASLLRTASPIRSVPVLPPLRPIGLDLLPPSGTDEVAIVARRALAIPVATVVRIPPAADSFGVVIEATRHAGEQGVLVITASIGEASTIARRLRRIGIICALMPDDWARAATGGCVVVGTRASAWAPIAQPGAIVVLDEHDDVYTQEQMPTWNARDIAVERGARFGVPVLLVSSVPSVVATKRYPMVATSRSFERSNWPLIELVDRSQAEPGRQGLLSERLAQILRGDHTVVCVLNRKGRAALSVCVGCTDVARCERCDGSLVLHETESGEREFRCQRCALVRPILCAGCGRSAFKNVRMGVTRAREEIEALAMRPVAELTADSDPIPDSVRVIVGTEAALHRVPSADIVVFLDMDSELFAPRFRASEQSLGLIARAAKLVSPAPFGPRSVNRQGRIVIQTRVPEHEVLRSVVLGDPTRFTEAEIGRREILRFPPAVSFAEVSGAGAPAVIGALRESVGVIENHVDVVGPPGGPFLVRADSPEALADALAECERPSGRVRVEVDPLRV